jgi:hypothetical protein
MTYCGTEWLIGVNVTTGWFLTNSKNLGPLCSRHSFSSQKCKLVRLWDLNLSIKTIYEYIKTVFWNHKTIRVHHCTGECEVVNPFFNKMCRKIYLILSFKYVLLQISPFQHCRPQETVHRELCIVWGEFRSLGERGLKVWS